jgi:hypothetical protein
LVTGDYRIGNGNQDPTANIFALFEPHRNTGFLLA